MSERGEFWLAFFDFMKALIQPVPLLTFVALVLIWRGIADLSAIMRYAHDIIGLLRGCG